MRYPKEILDLQDLEEDSGMNKVACYGSIEDPARLDSNNVAEISTMVQYLGIALRNGHSYIVIEGKSQIVIGMENCVQNGTPVKKNCE